MNPQIKYHTDNLITAFEAVGVCCTEADVPIILAKGADRFLAEHYPDANVIEEELTSIYIIMTELRKNLCLVHLGGGITQTIDR